MAVAGDWKVLVVGMVAGAFCCDLLERNMWTAAVVGSYGPPSPLAKDFGVRGTCSRPSPATCRGVEGDVAELWRMDKANEWVVTLRRRQTRRQARLMGGWRAAAGAKDW